MAIEFDDTEIEFLVRKLFVTIDTGQSRMSHAASRGDHFVDPDAETAKRILNKVYGPFVPPGKDTLSDLRSKVRG